MALNLNYTPTRLVDITTLTEDQWLDWRKKGIGGSDVAAALNMSPYRTARDLYYDKIGVVPAVEGPDKSITFQIGHLLEDVVAQIFAKKTGLTVYEDHWMYQHPQYPFLIADVDRFVLLPDGRKAILECKTAHYDMQFKWANGAVPRHYELQVRHYMSVMNIDVAFIVCLFSNNENDFVWQKIERDVEEEDGVNQESWRFCPMCGQQIEWDKVTDVVWEEKSCDICGGWLIKKHPLGFWYASSDYIGETTCRTCWLEECCTTNCLACQRGHYPDCKWVHLKQFYLEEEHNGK